MLASGLSFLVFWLLFSVFTVTLAHAALATAIIFIVLGLVLGEYKPWINRP